MHYVCYIGDGQTIIMMHAVDSSEASIEVSVDVID
jgi:hypothetical protein